MIQLYPEYAKQRIEICLSCPKLVLKSVCELCNCPIYTKALLPSATCPADKWTATTNH